MLYLLCFSLLLSYVRPCTVHTLAENKSRSNKPERRPSTYGGWMGLIGKLQAWCYPGNKRHYQPTEPLMLTY